MRDQFLESNMPPFQGSISPTFEHLCSMATMSDPSRTFAKSPAPKVQQDEGTHILGHQGTFKQEPSRTFHGGQRAAKAGLEASQKDPS